MKPSSREKHIQYAQLRRDNENEAREELERRLPANVTDLKRRGDMTKPAKVMLAALLYFRPDTEITKPISRRDFSGDNGSKEYARMRRANEVQAREALLEVLPEDLVGVYADRTDFNQTTKVIIAAARYFDLLNDAQERGDDEGAAGATSLPQPSPPVNINLDLKPPPLKPSDVSPPSPRGTKRAREEIDILADVRRDEKEQERIFLELKSPPQKPCRTASTSAVTENVSRPSTISPIERSQARIARPRCTTRKNSKKRGKNVWLPVSNPGRAVSADESLNMPANQAVRATAMRLVAKVDEMVMNSGGFHEKTRDIVADVHDLMIDLISVLEHSANEEKQKEVIGELSAKKTKWKAEGVEFQ